jgi:hypothetical protein
MGRRNNEEVAVVVRIEVHDHEGMRSAIQDIIPAVVILLRFLAKNAPSGFFRTKDIFHTPWGPESVHILCTK